MNEQMAAKIVIARASVKTLTLVDWVSKIWGVSPYSLYKVTITFT